MHASDGPTRWLMLAQEFSDSITEEQCRHKIVVPQPLLGKLYLRRPDIDERLLAERVKLVGKQFHWANSKASFEWLKWKVFIANTESNLSTLQFFLAELVGVASRESRCLNVRNVASKYVIAFL
jgi:hypothetical protein